MKFSLTLALPDKPGQLLRALEPIAKNGGNIISIIHERDKPIEGYVPVSLVVDFLSHQSFRKTIEDLMNLGITIMKSEEVIERLRLTLILVGNMDPRRVIESGIEEMHVINIEMTRSILGEVSARLEIEVPVDSVEKVIHELKRVVVEQGAMLIPPIGI
ncbi:MAG: ACT domain-containing protein [Candidatus Bathyarchaeia archaeon]|nr:ACT domain-containing protein [Candidatus Bathyarchaeota archaeon]